MRDLRKGQDFNLITRFLKLNFYEALYWRESLEKNKDVVSAKDNAKHYYLPLACGKE